jgi:hypothetical protein
LNIIYFFVSQILIVDIDTSAVQSLREVDYESDAEALRDADAELEDEVNHSLDDKVPG